MVKFTDAKTGKSTMMNRVEFMRFMKALWDEAQERKAVKAEVNAEANAANPD